MSLRNEILKESTTVEGDLEVDAKKFARSMTFAIKLTGSFKKEIKDLGRIKGVRVRMADLGGGAEAGFRRLKDLGRNLAGPLEDYGDKVKKEADRLTPVETGALKASGMRWPAVKGRHGASVKITYGGPSAPRYVNYAIYVHEILEARHAPPTQAKFLEQPMRAKVPEFRKDISKAVKDQIRKAGI